MKLKPIAFAVPRSLLAAAIKARRMTAPGFEQTENEIRYRLKDPGAFRDGSFRRKQITPGVSLVLGKRPGSDTMEPQAVRFDKGKFDLSKAKAWIKTHRSSLK